METDLIRSVRDALARDLPDTLIPRIFRVHAALPLAGNGKIDRKRLVADFLAEAEKAPAAVQRRPELDTAFAEPVSPLERWIASEWCDLIGIDRVGRDDRFFELGGTSLMAMRFLERLRAGQNITLSVASFFDGPTVRAIARAGAPRVIARVTSRDTAGTPAKDDRIAIVGVGGRFAGAGNVDAFWDMLLEGRSGRVEVTRDDLIAAGEDPALLDDPDYVAACFPLEDADKFDAAFFGFNPREVELMDPQQRLLLEVAFTTLEDAGHNPGMGGDRIGVFAGVGRNAYLLNNLMSHPVLRASAHEYSMLIGNERDFPATHIAYRLGLHGPALTVQTACSTSGVAIHMAAEALRRGECDLALAGGAKVLVPNRTGYRFTDGGPLSPDGFVRAFDAGARGMVRGSGAAMVALKRLDAAMEAGDHIYAVLIGSAINNDGETKAGFTAPSVSGQAEVIAGAHARAGITADSVTLIEAHGTGTELGDPIEVEGLTRAFRQTTDKAGFCAIGSVKTNIGHLDAGATAAGVIKAALALKHRTIPPSINFSAPNPKIGFDGSPFFVASEKTAWAPGLTRRRAGVSSFGLGGTNVHLLLEEAPAREASIAAEGPQLLVLSARTQAALDRRCADLADWLDRNPEANLADVAHTLRVGRQRFEKRLLLVAGTVEEASRLLRERNPRRLVPGGTAQGASDVAFLFPGGGAQYAGMALGLYAANATFRAAIDRCERHLRESAGWSLLDLLRRDTPLEAPAEALPALFAVEYAMAQVWLGLGLQPRAMIGHSVGEYAAACVAGVFTLEDALDIVLARGQLFETLPPGEMLSVPLGEAALRARLTPDLSLAAINRPDSSVVSGPCEAIEAFAGALTAEGIESRRIHINVAAHSTMVEPILKSFGDTVRKARLSPPKLPFLSNLTGTWITDAEATDPDYWVRHLRGTVRFSDGVGEVLAQGDVTLIEVGPGQILSTLSRQHPARGAGHEVVASIRHPQEPADDAEFLLGAVGRFWMAGGNPDWTAFAPGRHNLLSLPTYPFQRTRHWVDALPFAGETAARPAAAELAAPVPAETAQAAVPATRRERFLAQLIDIVQRLSGLPAERVTPHASFLELGFDSLFLTQLNAAFKKAFKVRLTTRQLMESLSCLDLLAGWLDGEVPEGIEPVAAPAAAAGAGAGPAAVRAEDSPGRPTVKKTAAAELTPEQEAHIDAMIARVNQRTPLAKAEVQRHRKVLADPRTVQGFRSRWKEMVYPVLSDRAEGSKIWDLDGNEYIDLVGGYGVTLFGHRPDFLTEAMRDQVDKTLAIGPQTVLAGEVAQLVSDLTGMERVAFCNTGSEAVLAAVRMARTVTGKSKIVKFDGHYHGIFDEMQVRGSGSGPKLMTVPSAPGIPSEAIQNTIIVKYGDPGAFDVIRAEASDIALVLVEPVRSRNPDFQPKEYLKDLRRLTEELGIPLLFDEMVTGFRSHPGGAQHLFGIRADIATYGKVAGGGLPIGIVAGSATYMDALDGGFWQFGDDSAPPADMTWFAGTFVRHPLALATARAALGRLKAEGPALQERLTARSLALAAAMNAEARRLGAPVKVEQFASVLRITFTTYQEYSDLLFFHMRNRGILTYEGRPIFLTTAHDDADCERIVTAFRESLSALVSVGLLDGRDPDALRRLPMATGQQEIWITAQFSAESSCAYNLCSTLDLTGALDTAALRQALDDLVARHEALRSVPDADGATQTIRPVVDLPHADFDLSGLDEASRNKRHEEIRQAEVHTPFDLANGPLVRTRLIRLAPDHHQLLLTVHHVIADGWSCGVLLRDLAALYDARHKGREPDLPPAQQLSDFIAFLRHPDQVASRAEARSYWLGLHEGELQRVDFPTDRPRPTSRSYAAKRIQLPVDPAVWADLVALAKANGTTLFAALMGGFGAYLTRITGAANNAIGFSAAGQPLLGGASLVGHCVNFLPLRLATDLSRTYGAQVKAIGSTILDALENQNFDFVSFVQELQPNRDVDWAPLITTGLNLDPSSKGVVFGDLQAVADSVGRAFEQLDLFLNFVETERELILQCTYNAALFDEATVRQRLGEYLRLMANGTRLPETPLAELPLLDAGEQRLLAEVSAMDRPHPRDRSMAELFRETARRLPQKAALIVPAVPDDPVRAEMSYAELDARSDGWASVLQDIGVGPGDFVPLLLNRSPDFVVAVLAVLKAGAAYVPIEPETAKARCSFILEDCGAKVLMTHADFVPGLDLGPTAALVMDRMSPPSRVPAPVAHDPDAAAYLMYTSGSTGQPKGVMVPHRGITRLLWNNDYARMDETRVTAQLTAVGFDLSTWEMWSALALGGTLVLPRGNGVPDLARLKHMLRDGGVTSMMISTAIFNNIIDEDPGVFAGVEEIIVAGEAMSVPHVRRAHEALPGLTLINGYGPTEVTVIVTAYRVPRDIGPEVVSVPIGRPVNATTAYVMDQQQNLLPPGVPGELVLGGDGVGMGYWRRPDLTAASFIPDRITGKPGALLYRTGDICRFRPDGTLDYVGRRDNQVKIRGVRVELGEVEAALSAVDGVKTAAVLHDKARGRLVGFVVAEDPGLTEARITRALRHVLPRHVQPSRIELIPDMPLSKNGKIDRKALAQMLESGADRPAGMAPSTPTEQALAEIWRDILGHAVTSAEDSFFEMGGHSLQAVRMVSRIRRDFGTDLPIGTLFTHPTLRDLAELIDDQANRAPEHASDTVDPKDRPWDTSLVLDEGPGTLAPPVFIVGGIGGNLNDMVDITRELSGQRPVIGFQTRGILGHRPRRSIEAIAAEHLHYMRQHQPAGPYRLIGYSAGAVIAFEMARQLEARGEAIASLILLDGPSPRAIASSGTGRSSLKDRLAHEIYLIRDHGVSNLVTRSGHLAKNLYRKINPSSVRHNEVAQAWMSAYFAYAGGSYGGPLNLVLTKPDGFRARKLLATHPSLGWDHYVDPARLRIHRIDSGHRTMLVGDEARALASLILRLEEVVQ